MKSNIITNSKNTYVKKILFIPVLFLLFSSCHVKEEGKRLKLAHGLDPSHPVHKAMVYMADRCSEISEGELKIDIYPSGQLGSEQQCVELLQIGSLAITKVSSAVLESFAVEFKALGLPYIFRSREHAFRVFESETGDELLDAIRPKLLKGLCFYDAGARSFYTIDTPVKTPDDLDGLKIRVMKSIVSMNLVKSLGGSPTPISWGELYTALQSGVVDGAENNPPSFYTSRHYEVCKYYSLNEHSMIPDVLVISLKIWEDLTEKEQEWLMQAVDESVEVEKRLWKESEEESLAAVKEAGVEIIYPDKELFADKVDEVYEMYRDQPEVYGLIQKIKTLHE